MKRIPHAFLWLLLLPFVLAAFWLLRSDALCFLSWWLALTAAGWLFWPLSLRLFSEGEESYLFAKGLGLGIPALMSWTLSYLHLLPFARWSILLLLLVVFYFSWIRHGRYQEMARLLTQPDLTPRWVASECFFIGTLLFWTFARGLKPELDSLEKFMDIGFMNSIWRTKWLPAPDMWYAGFPINYYYFGQFVYTCLAKLVNIRPEISYNLGLSTTFSMTAILSYVAGSRLVNLLKQDEKQIGWGWPVAGGLLSSFLITVGGNSHAFFFSDNAPGKGLLRWAADRGFFPGANLDGPYWFADATRFIGYNPDTLDKTIHEFPYYSFLVADLHAHVINLAFVLLLLSLLTVLMNRPQLLQAAADCKKKQEELSGCDDKTWHQGQLKAAFERFQVLFKDRLVWLMALLLSIFMMANYWDFVIYLLVIALVLVLMNSRGYSSRIRISSVFVLALQAALVIIPYLGIKHPVWALLAFFFAAAAAHYLTILCGDALTLAGAQVTWLFFLSQAIALPFNLFFDPISKNIARTVSTTPFWQLFVLWGPHVLAGLIFLITLLIGKTRPRIRSFPPPVGSEINAQKGIRNRFFPLASSDRLVFVFLFCGIALLILPEWVYVVDIYSGAYKRANTMFKFTYQAFVLLSLAWAYAVVRLASFPKRRKVRLVSVVLSLMLIIPAWYAPIATRQWLGAFSRERYQGLNGLSLFGEKDSEQIPGQTFGELSPDVSAINWLNKEVSGQPVILESFGESYTDYARISAFTGLPTVLGWETHEWLWRTSQTQPDAYSACVLPRQMDIETLYTTTDQSIRLELIKKYEITYLIVGDMERARFRSDEDENSPSLVQEDLLKELGPIVFQEGSLYIIQVSGQG